MDLHLGPGRWPKRQGLKSFKTTKATGFRARTWKVMCCKAAPRYRMPCTFSTHVWNLHLNKNQPQSKTVCIANEPELNTGNDLYKKPTPTKPTCHLMAITTLGPAVLPAKPGRLQVERHQPPLANHHIQHETETAWQPRPAASLLLDQAGDAERAFPLIQHLLITQF